MTVNLEDEWLWRRCRKFLNSRICTDEAAQLFPGRALSPPKIETPNTVLLYRLTVHQFIMPLLIVSEDNPTLRSDDVQPLVILGVMREPIAGIVVPLNATRRVCALQSLRQALPDIAVKIQCQ